MAKTSKSAPAADSGRKQAVIYARVSSKEQEKEGFSIPAQLKLLKEYAAAQGFAVAQEYVDVETAKQTGRAAFGEMVAYLNLYISISVEQDKPADSRVIWRGHSDAGLCAI
jgi:predicted site-specific integrase-resolvase